MERNHYEVVVVLAGGARRIFHQYVAGRVEAIEQTWVDVHALGLEVVEMTLA